MTQFLLIRHGNTTAGESIPGRSPGVYLSEHGVGQVQRLAERLAGIPIDLICASPLERTRQTAEIIAEKLGQQVEFIDDLIEIEFGDWTNHTFSELEGDMKWTHWHSFRTGTRIPNGEMMIEVQARMAAQVEKLRRRIPDGTIALISHGDPIRSLICHYAGLPIDYMLRVRMDTASLTVLHLGEFWAEFACINVTEELPFK